MQAEREKHNTLVKVTINTQLKVIKEHTLFKQMYKHSSINQRRRRDEEDRWRIKSQIDHEAEERKK